MKNDDVNAKKLNFDELSGVTGGAYMPQPNQRKGGTDEPERVFHLCPKCNTDSWLVSHDYGSTWTCESCHATWSN